MRSRLQSRTKSATHFVGMAWAFYNAAMQQAGKTSATIVRVLSVLRGT